VSRRARLRVHWEGEFAGPGSCAQVNVELARRLAGRVKLSLSPWPASASASPAPVDPRLAALVCDPPAGVDVTIRHGSPPRLTPPERGRWVWMQPWEYGSGIPVDWGPLMREQADAVLVFSDWVAGQLVAAGVPADRVHSVPHGVDVERFHPAAAPLALPTRKRLRLLYVGGLTHRKGIDILLRAYRRAFTATDDVALVVRAFDPDGRYTPVALNDFEQDFADAGAPELVVLREHLAPEEMPGLYTACDAFVHPYRAEGFCLPIAEAMACGLPVVTTDRGGASGVAMAETATLLPSYPVYMPVLRLGDRDLTNLPFWREVPESDLVDVLQRLVVGSLDGVADRAARARARVMEMFTWDAAADRLHAVLERLVAQPRRADEPPGSGRGQSPAAAVAAGELCLRRRDLEGAGAAFHRALGLAEAWRDVPQDDDAVIAALAGMGEVAGGVGLPENAYRFHRLALGRRPADVKLRLATATWAARTGRVQEATQNVVGLVGDGVDSERAFEPRTTIDRPR
jgi:glycosyltransferase involved in cell wall biosynthesis